MVTAGFFGVILALLAALISIKVVLYFMHKSLNDTWANLFYYPVIKIVLTENHKRRKVKQIQNFLSQVIFVLFIFYWVLLYLIRQQ